MQDVADMNHEYDIIYWVMWYGIWQCHDMVDYMFEKSTVHIMWFGIITGDMTYENYLHSACVLYIYMRVIPKIWSSIWHDAIIIIIKHNKTIYNIFGFFFIDHHWPRVSTTTRSFHIQCCDSQHFVYSHFRACSNIALLDKAPLLKWQPQCFQHISKQLAMEFS